MEKIWNEVKASGDPVKLVNFAESFPGTAEGYQARELAGKINEALSSTITADDFRVGAKRIEDSGLSYKDPLQYFIKRDGLRARVPRDLERLKSFVLENALTLGPAVDRVAELQTLAASLRGEDERFEEYSRKKEEEKKQQLGIWMVVGIAVVCVIIFIAIAQ